MTWLAQSAGARRAIAACVLALGGLVVAARAQAPLAEPALPPIAADAAVDYSALHASDPLDRARAVARLGDVRVAARLGRTEALEILAAVRSARFLGDPTRALPTLLPIMQGRDPDLAPAAAEAVVEIARQLVEARCAPEELAHEQLEVLTKQLGAIEQNTRVRADIRLAAIEAAALLKAARERL